MGATKTDHYAHENKQLALVARALAHPARIEIMKRLRQEQICRSTDLVKLLQLSKSSVFEHVLKLRDAELVYLDYHPHCYHLSLIEKNIEQFSLFVHDA